MTTLAQLLSGGVQNPSGSPSWLQSDPYSNALNMTYGGTNYGTNNLQTSQLDPQTLQALEQMGWTGGNPIQTMQGNGGSQDQAPTATTNTFSPQFQQWLAQNGITPAQLQQADSGGNNQVGLGFYNGSSTSPTTGQIGDTTNFSTGNDRGLTTAAAIGLGGAGLLGAGLIGGAGAAGSPIGFSAAGADASLLPAGYAAPTGFAIPESTGGLGAAFGDTGAGFADAGAAYPTFGSTAGAASGAGTGGGFGGGLFGGAGDIGTGFGGTGFTGSELLSGAAGTSGLAGAADGFGGGINDTPSPGILSQIGSALTGPAGQGLSGLGSALLGTGVGLATGSLGKGNTGLLNQVNYQNAATASGQSARTNQSNAQGNLTYTQTGTDAQGNPTYSQNVSLNAPYQANLNSALANQGGALGNLTAYNQGLPAAYAAAPSIYGNAGSQADLVKQAQDAAYNSQTQYLDPQYAQLQKQLQAQLANQGVTYGSNAYNAANTQLGSQQNQAYGSARDSAIAQGDAYANTLFNQNLAANQQYNTNLNNQGANYLNQSSGALNGITQNPTFATPPPATNYLGAAQLQGYANLNQYKAQTGNQNSLNDALTGIGTAALGNPNVRTGIGNVFSGLSSGLSNLFGSGGG